MAARREQSVANKRGTWQKDLPTSILEDLSNVKREVYHSGRTIPLTAPVRMFS
jgi:hypothetical protein